MTHEEAATMANEVAALAGHLAASATRLADALKQLDAHPDPDTSHNALTEDYEGEDG